MPPIRLAHREVRSALNPLGVRGVGESGTIAVAAAVAAAVDDAVGGHVASVPIEAESLVRPTPAARPAAVV